MNEYPEYILKAMRQINELDQNDKSQDKTFNEMWKDMHNKK